MLAIVTGANGNLHLSSQGLYTPLDTSTPLSNAFIDFLNTSFGLTLPYGTTNGDMVAVGLTDPLTLCVHYRNGPALRTLIVHCRDDRVIPPSAPYDRPCGHWTQIEHAREFNRLVVDFLSDRPD